MKDQNFKIPKHELRNLMPAFTLPLAFLLIISACNEQESVLHNKDSELNISMIAIDIYRGSIDNSLALVFMSDDSTILVKSSGFLSLVKEDIPPPPPNVLNYEHNHTTYNIVSITTEVLKLEKEFVEKIRSLLKVFWEKDLKNHVNSIKIDDGIGIKVTIIYSDKSLNEFTLINDATGNQKEFLDYIFETVIQRSNINKENLTLFLSP